MDNTIANRLRFLSGFICVSSALIMLLMAFTCPLEGKEKYIVKPFEAEVGEEPHTFIENTYLVYNTTTQDAVIIDPGSQVEEMESLIKESSLKVRAILNTHGHHDHIGGNAYYAKLYAVPIYAHKDDAPHYEKENKKHAPKQFIQNEKQLDLPGFEFKVMHTPGHSMGSVCYYLKGLLFSGDTLFEESIGRTWGKTEEEEEKKTQQEIKSIREKLLILPEETKVFPGHGSSTTIKHEKEKNPFLQ